MLQHPYKVFAASLDKNWWNITNFFQQASTYLQILFVGMNNFIRYFLVQLLYN